MKSDRKDFQLLDLRLFKAFMAAAEAQNFTLAAQKAYMTQSGVSQQIAKLEEQIGLPLFKRLGKKVILTEVGMRLVEFIETNRQATEFFIDSIHGDNSRLKGVVSYAMPPSCLLSPHFPLLLEKRLAHPDIELHVHLASSAQVLEMVLADTVDFGFVTHKLGQPGLDYRMFCQEEYILVGSDPETLDALAPEEIPAAKVVHYPGSELYYNRWLAHHCGEASGLSAASLSAAGKINSIEGAILMVEGGLGIGVFPRHCVQEAIEEGRLYAFGNGGSEAPLNDIYIATITGHPYPRRVGQVIDWFMAMHSCPAPS